MSGPAVPAAQPAAPAPARDRAEVCRLIARSALGALLDELAAFPKPGLVSPLDAGAHPDMDASTFFRSLLSLRTFFPAVARAGLAEAPFAALRQLGIAAEASMLRATGGVNTHRGAIFTLGLLAAAAGRLAARGATWAGAALGTEVREAFGQAIAGALPRSPASHGSEVARVHGVGGAREEARGGFPLLFGVALPALEGALRGGAPPRAAAVECLLRLVAVLPDTNLLHRGGREGLAFARSSARGFVEAGGVHRRGWEERVLRIHRAFVARRLSPGGSADLLAATLLVHRLQTSGR